MYETGNPEFQFFDCSSACLSPSLCSMVPFRSYFFYRSLLSISQFRYGMVCCVKLVVAGIFLAVCVCVRGKSFAWINLWLNSLKLISVCECCVHCLPSCVCRILRAFVGCALFFPFIFLSFSFRVKFHPNLLCHRMYCSFRMRACLVVISYSMAFY